MVIIQNLSEQEVNKWQQNCKYCPFFHRGNQCDIPNCTIKTIIYGFKVDNEQKPCPLIVK